MSYDNWKARNPADEFLGPDPDEEEEEVQFRILNAKQERLFRKWARDNYKPGAEINELWHPVVRDECFIMNTERRDGKDNAG